MLHAKDLNIISASINTVNLNRKLVSVKYQNDVILLTSDQEVLAGEIIINISYDAKITDTLHGLYPCYYKHNNVDRELLVTQLESHHAREVFPCIDEPEAKATFDLELITEQGVTVLGNMPVKSVRTGLVSTLAQASTEGTPTKSQTQITTFQTSPIMSPYLLAFVIGNLHNISGKTRSGIEVSCWVTESQPKSDLKFALDTAIKSVEFLEDYFGVKYPLPKLDNVAVPDFAAGAMENWGLVTYREACLLLNNNSSIDTKHYTALVIAHEVSHQWFGNLVTMRWWDDLWLNESFANMMEYLVVENLYPDWNIWLKFISDESHLALHRDWLPGVQPVYSPVNNPDEINTLFDPAIVYAKGGQILNMLRNYIGENNFRLGLKYYFEKHAYKNTARDDLWSALSQYSNKNIKEFMRNWLTKPHYPVISITKEDDKYKLSQAPLILGNTLVHNRDRSEESNIVWPVYLDANCNDFPEIFECKEKIVCCNDGNVFLNENSISYFITNYSDEMFNVICKKLVDLPPINRFSVLHEANLLAEAGLKSSSSIVDLLLNYKDEQEYIVWEMVHRSIQDLRKFLEPNSPEKHALKQLTASLARPIFAKLEQRKAEKSIDDMRLTALIARLLIFADDKNVINYYYNLFSDNFEQLSGEARELAFHAAVKINKALDIEKLLELSKNSNNPEVKNIAMLALCSTHNQKVVETLLNQMQDRKLVRNQDLHRWFRLLMSNKMSRDLAWDWLRNYWPEIKKMYDGDKEYDRFPRYAGNCLSTKEQLDEYRNFFGPLNNNSALEKIVKIGEAEILARLAWLERDTKKVRDKLLDYSQ
jgi:aminopeptidase N